MSRKKNDINDWITDLMVSAGDAVNDTGDARAQFIYLSVLNLSDALREKEIDHKFVAKMYEPLADLFYACFKYSITKDLWSTKGRTK